MTEFRNSIPPHSYISTENRIYRSLKLQKKKFLTVFEININTVARIRQDNLQNSVLSTNKERKQPLL